MPRILVLFLLLVSASAVVGCGAHGGATKVTTAPANALLTDCARDEAIWTPPVEVAMSFAADRESPERASVKTVSLRPNRQDRPILGAVHAAAY